MSTLNELQKTIKIKFKDKNLLKTVFIHRSYLNENPNLKLPHNERLEFLGDAVLELAVTEYLYKKYKKPEGVLTNWRAALVCGKMLSWVAKKIGIGKLMKLSRGEEKSGGKERDMIMANTFEALIGAIYLDQGYPACQKFIKKQLITSLPKIIKRKLYIDAKSALQEKTQEEMRLTPTYEVLEESGPDHAKHFKIGVFLENKQIGKGEGASKQSAQQEAAKDALKKMGI